MNSIPVTINGKDYLSLSAAARAYGISLSTLQNRLKTGCSIEEALNKPLGSFPRPKAIVIDNKEYSSLAAAATAHGLNFHTFRNRLKLGYSLQDAVFLPMHANKYKGKARQTVILNKKHRSIAEAAKYYGVSESKFRSRLRKGIKPELAVDPDHLKRISLSFRGYHYPSIRSLLKDYRIPKSSIGYYTKYKKLSHIQAAELIIKPWMIPTSKLKNNNCFSTTVLPTTKWLMQ